MVSLGGGKSLLINIYILRREMIITQLSYNWVNSNDFYLWLRSNFLYVNLKYNIQ